MFEEERKISILNKIQSDGSVTVANLSKKYQVSESTIRRDLSTLETAGYVKRTHGGAILVEAANEDYNYNAKKGIHITQKYEIAEKAASMIKDSMTVFLGTSTITNVMTQYLTARNLTIATNSLDVINAVANRPEYNLIILGGNYIHRGRTIEGIAGLNQAKQLHFHQVFLGANGIDLNFGISTVGEIEATSKQTIMQNSSSTYFVCDSNKFDCISQYKIADINQVTGIITDSKLSTEILTLYEARCNIITN